MLWGAGETPVKILPSFTPSASYGIKWGRALDGSSFHVDRGINSDIHFCGLTCSGRIADVLASYEAIAGSLTTGSASVQLESGEWIFGPATCLVSTYALCVESVGKIERTGLNSALFQFSVSGSIAYCPDFTGALPTAFIPSMSHATENSVGSSIARSYNVASGDTVVRKISTSFAEFSFSQVMDFQQSAELQNYFETMNRGDLIDTVDVPEIKGVDYPFGLSYSYPCGILLREVSFEPYTPNYWRVKVTIQRAQ